MNLKIKLNQYPQCRSRIHSIANNIDKIGTQWTEYSVKNLKKHLCQNLTDSKKTPPLTSATRQIYARRGNPDGSGIRNHLEISYSRIGDRTIAILGIAPGKPTTVARVQEHGCNIRVTQKMRNYLAVYGIHLRADTRMIRIPPRRFWSKGNTTANREAKQELKRLFETIWHHK